MQIKYVGPASEGVVLSPSGVEFLPGVPVEVDDDVALSLLEQDTFEAVDTVASHEEAE